MRISYVHGATEKARLCSPLFRAVTLVKLSGFASDFTLTDQTKVGFHFCLLAFDLLDQIDRGLPLLARAVTHDFVEQFARAIFDA